MERNSKSTGEQEIDFETFRVEDLTHENVKQLSPEQQRILKLEKRCADLEEQMLGCLSWMRREAEEKAREVDPTYPVHSSPKA